VKVPGIRSLPFFPRIVIRQRRSGRRSGCCAGAPALTTRSNRGEYASPGKANRPLLVGLAAIAATGLLLGFRFGFPALLAASFVLACAAGLVGALSGWPFWTTISRVAAFLAVLQVCYLLALWLSAVLTRLVGRHHGSGPTDRGS
jgi:hypothetical protein